MNRVFAGNIALSEVDTWKTCCAFSGAKRAALFFLSFCPDSTIEKIRVDQRRKVFGCLNAFGVLRLNQPMPIL